jgi:ribosome-associated toxin RatA of RatAB toxin-antitoxin module
MPNDTSNGVIRASLFVPSSTARNLYEVVLDVRSFPRWAPGIRRVEVLTKVGEPGMVSEWEVCVLGMKRKVLSVLKEADPPALLRWSYEGLVRGWGQCSIADCGDGALAEFQTEMHSTEPILEKLMLMHAAKSAATSHLKRCLTRLGRTVSGDSARIQVGPPAGLG